MNKKISMYIFFALLVVIDFYSISLFLQKRNEVVSCTAFHTIFTKDKIISSSMNIFQHNGEGVNFLSGTYSFKGKEVKFRISKPFSYTKIGNSYYYKSKSITIYPENLRNDKEFIEMLPVFLRTEKTQANYSTRRMNNGDFTINEGAAPGLYCLTVNSGRMSPVQTSSSN